MKILVVNVGSTSLKFRLFDMQDECVIAVGKIERVGSERSPVSYEIGDDCQNQEEIECSNHRTAIEYVLKILTDPTAGGITASFAMLGDIILAEPNALIGFAGARVIKQTIGEDLPEGFQRSEFLLEKGFIDHIVGRKELKTTLSDLFSFFNFGKGMNKNENEVEIIE